ncbi:MAG: hypothetical protein M1839_007310 [Geoglossum umbratile]|nr:MAG: hypothetical protein M1839_007310 [Geoglossum umbratile]
MGSIDQSNEYKCLTQESDLPSFGSPPIANKSKYPAIVLGVGPIVPRWDVSKSDTKLLCFVTNTFPSPGDKDYAAQSFQQAADEWNALGLGVTISQTTTEASANFNLVYEKGDPGEFAKAFFPHQTQKDVIMYEYALDTNRRGFLKNVFMHELGHVLGLRHEFAIAREGRGAVQFMQTNPVSVMSYNIPPNMQQSDKDGIQAFYKLEGGDKIEGSRVTDYLPQLRKSP